MSREVICPKCSTAAEASAVRCSKCGTRLGVDFPPVAQGRAAQLSNPFAAYNMAATVTDNEESTGTIDNIPELVTAERSGLQFQAPLEVMPAAATTTAPELTLTPTPPIQLSDAVPRRVSSGVRAVAELFPSAPNPSAPRRPSAPTHPPQAGDTAAEASSPPARKDPLSGERLGDYIVEEKIGAGGMGVVYRARQPQIGSTVAIKILRGDVIADKRDMQRLLDEARVVNAIKHRGIINIFGAGELPDGRQYLVMEYLEGETLEKRLERVGKLTTTEALPILDEVLAALAAAHGTGIVHRDLKPANIFLVKQSDGPDLVKLLDFGLARRNHQEVSRIAGTPEYISPEHARGRPAGPPADLYGFGILAFHLLTGQLPFTGSTPIEMMEKHVHAKPPIPTEVNPEIPSAMSGLILALLEKDPANRPDATQAKLDLKAAAKQLQQATRGGSVESLPKLSAPAEPDPRLKQLARKADLAMVWESIGRNWPWGLAALGVLWLAGVLVWMTVTGAPTAAPPTTLPVKRPTRPPMSVVQRNPAPVPVEPASAPPTADAPGAVKAPALAKPRAEAVLGKTRRELVSEWMMLDELLTGQLSTHRPALNLIKDALDKATSDEDLRAIDARLSALEANIKHDTEAGLE